MTNALIYSGNYFTNESHFESAFNSLDLRECLSNDILLHLPKQLPL